MKKIKQQINTVLLNTKINNSKFYTIEVKTNGTSLKENITSTFLNKSSFKKLLLNSIINTKELKFPIKITYFESFSYLQKYLFLKNKNKQIHTIIYLNINNSLYTNSDIVLKLKNENIFFNFKNLIDYVLIKDLESGVFL